MTSFEARYFDGRTSARHAVRITAEGGDRLRIQGTGFGQSCPLAQLRFSPRIGSTPRIIHLPNGAQCETADNEAVDRLLASARRDLGAELLHQLESRAGVALAALMVTVMLVWVAIDFGIPYLAKEVAFVLPPSIEARLGAQGLSVLDRTLFQLSELSTPEKQRLAGLFRAASKAYPEPTAIRLEFRHSRALGANALALPAGIVVITDDLVKLANNDHELLAVLAHEVGHLRHRHFLRAALQKSTTALVVAGVIGDLTALTSLPATFPTLLTEARYSRHFELEADQYAVRFLDSQDIPRAHFANILKRLSDDADQGLLSCLATHPETPTRIERIQSP
jgi:Zn-dependent protease with chaperone function